MHNSWPSFLTWVLITVAVGVSTSIGWPGFVIAGLLGVALWIMLSCKADALERRRAVTTKSYALAALVAVPLGYLFFRLGDGNTMMWVLAFIVVGTIFPSRTATSSGDPARAHPA
ncbi:hypothetical protein [Arthrobacter flavus]|uniref:Uncharacterized protein n=1 Tax=Arthrobacter flavus TaxID=95172 RepID=A0ABW4Q951_9MICC